MGGSLGGVSFAALGSSVGIESGELRERNYKGVWTMDFGEQIKLLVFGFLETLFGLITGFLGGLFGFLDPS